MVSTCLICTYRYGTGTLPTGGWVEGWAVGTPWVGNGRQVAGRQGRDRARLRTRQTEAAGVHVCEPLHGVPHTIPGEHASGAGFDQQPVRPQGPCPSLR